MDPWNGMPPDLASLVLKGNVRLRNPGDVAVTNAAGGTLLLPSNPMRVAVVLSNASANRAHVTRRPGPTTSTGVPLDPTNGVITDDIRTAGRALGNEYWAIFETGSGNIYVEEYEAFE